MRWDRGRATPDVIDQRGGGGGGGRMGGMPIGRAGGGLGLMGVILVVVLQLAGGGGGGSAFAVDDPLGGLGAPAQGQPIPANQDADRDLRDFSAYVFTDAQERWQKNFAAGGKPYRKAKLVLFSGGVRTGGCGSASSAVGPFYCPADQRVYLDLSFYRDMTQQLKAPGDFAWAYVIAHEMGHHVQRQLGIAEQVDRLRREQPDQANALSVRQELQADCYAGVWANQVFAAGQLEEGDIDEAFTAAESVGDDRLQENAGRRVDQESFTHGSAEQRRRWFDAGRREGDPGACDTFAVDEV